MVILIDTREQCPLRFGPDVATERATLDAGDYSLPGLTERAAIERKSLPDLLACIGPERARFKRELLRLRSYPCRAVVVEAPLSDVLAGRYRARIHPAAALGSLASWQVRYSVPFWFAGDRDAAAAVVKAMLHNYLAQLRELVAVVKSMEDSR